MNNVLKLQSREAVKNAVQPLWSGLSLFICR
ncbi:hypothetical protein H4683_004078 [Filibacter limicola]|uniref:Uncharacterized protein n=1 Tax=Sporosarcina limicola TaxID=34101 RepID=A0A927RGZ3_9BACL|nr:hypothetical protein [Sporosarcina limicola]